MRSISSELNVNSRPDSIPGERKKTKQKEGKSLFVNEDVGWRTEPGVLVTDILVPYGVYEIVVVVEGEKKNTI